MLLLLPAEAGYEMEQGIKTLLLVSIFSRKHAETGGCSMWIASMSRRYFGNYSELSCDTAQDPSMLAQPAVSLVQYLQPDAILSAVSSDDDVAAPVLD